MMLMQQYLYLWLPSPTQACEYLSFLPVFHGFNPSFSFLALFLQQKCHILCTGDINTHTNILSLSPPIFYLFLCFSLSLFLRVPPVMHTTTLAERNDCFVFHPCHGSADTTGCGDPNTIQSGFLNDKSSLFYPQIFLSSCLAKLYQTPNVSFRVCFFFRKAWEAFVFLDRVRNDPKLVS